MMDQSIWGVGGGGGGGRTCIVGRLQVACCWCGCWLRSRVEDGVVGGGGGGGGGWPHEAEEEGGGGRRVEVEEEEEVDKLVYQSTERVGG